MSSTDEGEASAALGARSYLLLDVRRSRFELMSAGAIHIESFPGTAFPEGVEVHWKTEIRTVWNPQQYTSEERELVYEVSWIEELGAWRRFLRSQRKVQR